MGVYGEKANLGGLADCCLLICRLRFEESFLSKDVSTANHVTDPLLARVHYCHHEGPVKHEVNLIDLVALREDVLSLVNAEHLTVLNHDFIGIEAYFGEYFVVQTDFLETEHLVVCLPINSCILKRLNEILHLSFSISDVLLSFEMGTCGRGLATLIDEGVVVETKDVANGVGRGRERLDWCPSITAELGLLTSHILWGVSSAELLVLRRTLLDLLHRGSVLLGGSWVLPPGREDIWVLVLVVDALVHHAKGLDLGAGLVRNIVLVF